MRHLLRNPAVGAVTMDKALMALAQAVEMAQWVSRRHSSTNRQNRIGSSRGTRTPRCRFARRKKVALGWGPWSVKVGVTYAHAPATALSRIVALRLHLDDSNAANGPLRVLPGTHTLGVLTDEAIHDLAAKISPISCLVPRGGVLVMSPLIVHASSKALSRERRRVLHIEYATSVFIDDGLELATA